MQIQFYFVIQIFLDPTLKSTYWNNFDTFILLILIYYITVLNNYISLLRVSTRNNLFIFLIDFKWKLLKTKFYYHKVL